MESGLRRNAKDTSAVRQMRSHSLSIACGLLQGFLLYVGPREALGH